MNTDLANRIAITEIPDKHKFAPEPSALTLISVKPIKKKGLIRYLGKRGIPLRIAEIYLRELYVCDIATGKKLFTLGFRNQSGGWELFNPFYTGHLRPRDTSFINGRQGNKTIAVFADVFDYLSVLAKLGGKAFKFHSIILNDLARIEDALNDIRDLFYEKLESWMSNDEAGEAATQLFADFCAEQVKPSHRRMNGFYADYTTVNEWWIAESRKQEPGNE